MPPSKFKDIIDVLLVGLPPSRLHSASLSSFFFRTRISNLIELGGSGRPEVNAYQKVSNSASSAHPAVSDFLFSSFFLIASYYIILTPCLPESSQARVSAKLSLLSSSYGNTNTQQPGQGCGCHRCEPTSFKLYRCAKPCRSHCQRTPYIKQDDVSSECLELACCRTMSQFSS